MNKQKNKLFSLQNLMSNIKESYFVFINEVRAIFKDRGVMIIVVLAPIIYPLLYCSLYRNETLVNVPIAVVDASHSKNSCELLRHIDASPDVKIAYRFNSLEEAKVAFDKRDVKGVVYIPADFNEKINTQQQATVGVFCDMSSFMYYRALMFASNYSVLDMNKKIQIERLNAQGVTGENSTIQAEPIPFESNILFNGGMGFASFLMPAILILILHQTLFFGISMVTGTAREENRSHQLVSAKFNRGGVYRVLFGKAMSYFLIYLVWVYFILAIVPVIFNLPHIGNLIDIYKLMIPFLLATIFFSMTLSVFFPNRETAMIIFLFFSLILLFLCGISWPTSNINGFWRAFAWIFPSTHGIQGYIKINSMGADIHKVSYEYLSLWIQTAFYFLTASLTYTWQMRRSVNAEEQIDDAILPTNN
jgi:ABC-2 type transport system permease protein